jgi:hypothetical protein
MDLRQTGNPQTQPLGTADQEDSLGSVYWELDDTGGTGFKRYKFVEVDSEITSTTIPVGSVLYYTDAYNLVVTDKITASGAAINKVAGVAQVIMSPSKRCWIQDYGYHAGVLTDATSVVATDLVQASTTSGTIAIVAIGAAAIYPVLGRAVANKTGSPAKSAVFLHLGLTAA